MKKILVKDILAMMEDEEKVNVTLFAYGVRYANSNDCGETVKDVKENMIYDGLNAQVGRVTAENDILLIGAEMIHK